MHSTAQQQQSVAAAAAALSTVNYLAYARGLLLGLEAARRPTSPSRQQASPRPESPRSDRYQLVGVHLPHHRLCQGLLPLHVAVRLQEVRVSAEGPRLWFHPDENDDDTEREGVGERKTERGKTTTSV